MSPKRAAASSSAAGVDSPPAPVTREPATTPADPPKRLESTARAIVTGCAIGVVLAAGNVYTGMKTSFIDGGSITAALLGFMLFTTFKRLGRSPYGVFENNITQTTASSAAIMGFVTGVGGPIPAMDLLGQPVAWWVIATWGVALAMVGIVAGTLLRRKLVVVDALPFPTGAATAEVIETMYAARSTALRRARLLFGAALVAVAVTWFRDGRPSLIPQMVVFGTTVAGVATSSLTLGLSLSPLMLSTGALMGLRTTASMVVGALIAWVLLIPRLAHAGIVREASFSGGSAWLVWPGLGLLIAGSFLPLLLDGGSVVRSFRDLKALAARRPRERAEALAAAGLGRGAMALLLVGATAVIVVVGRMAFGIHPLVALAALFLALLLANVSGRATGETDLGPVGAVGMLTQLVFAGYGALVSVTTGWISMGTTSQTSQTLWAFRAGHRLGASPRAQVGAQMLGAVVGAIVVVPVYFVIVKTYGIGTEAMPAVSAVSWRATAEAVSRGLDALPPYGPQAGGLGLAIGVLLSVLARTRIARFTPSPAAMGIAMLSPASLSFATFTGALLVWSARRLRPSLDEPSVMAMAAGGIAGESLTGVIVAILIATGIL